MKKRWFAAAVIVCLASRNAGHCQEPGVDAANAVRSSEPPAIEIEDVSAFDTTPYVASILSSGLPPAEYLIEKFKAHDLVLLGEEHGIRENCQLVASIIEPLYRQAGVRRLATCFERPLNRNARATKNGFL